MAKINALHDVDHTVARFGKPDDASLCEAVAAGISADVLKNARRILDVGIGCGGISRAIVNRMVNELYIDWDDAIFRVYGVDNNQALVNKMRRLGFVNTVHADFLEWNPEMKFDLIVGNPPYGKNASLAVKFVNKSVELSDSIHYVLPRTFRKPSILNRIDLHLHLVEDELVGDEMFGGTILTCVQKWERRDNKRERVKTYTQHPDLQFVSKSESNIFVGRVGAAAGSVKEEGFDHYTEQHYFLQVSDVVRERLKVIQPRLRELAYGATVGTPSLSKHELISTYVDKFECKS